MPLYPNTDSYAHTYFCKLIILPFCSAATVSLRFINWTVGKGYIKKSLCRGLHFVDQNTQQTFRLLLLCHISELQDNKYTMITVKIRHIFEYEKKICLREKYFIRPLKFIWKTRIYKYIYVYKCGGRVYLGIKCSMLW